VKFHSKIKSAQKLGYRTPDYFKGATFGGQKFTKAIGPRFNPAQFKTQHKG